MAFGQITFKSPMQKYAASLIAGLVLLPFLGGVLSIVPSMLVIIGIVGIVQQWFKK